MAQSVRKDFSGPLWPLGLLGNNPAFNPGTPLKLMSLVDPGGANDPNTSSATVGQEFSPRCQQIIFQGFKAGAGGNGLQNNAGNIYVLRRGGTGSGNRADFGTMIGCVTPGTTFTLPYNAMNQAEFISPYDILLDADNATDSCLVTMVIAN